MTNQDDFPAAGQRLSAGDLLLLGRNQKGRRTLMFNGTRSLLSNARQGGEVIRGGVAELARSTSAVLEGARFESFEQALARLGVREQQLALIHNQLAAQVYVTGFVGFIAWVYAINLVLGSGTLFTAALAALVGAALTAKTAQASMQCFFIRRRQLGLANEWLVSPGEWLPDRLPGLQLMTADDPLRRTDLVARLAATSRRRFFTSAVLFAAAAGVGASVGFGSGLMLALCAAVTLVLACGASFEVFRRRSGVHCDLVPWLTTPRSWLPVVNAGGAAS